MKTFHIFFNAHLDPVWLWDWREGLNEGISTCRSMLRFFEKYPDFTFIRGESAIYEHIEKYDQESFSHIKKLVKDGRWDIVGGNYVQTDTNIPSTTTFLKQYQYGKQYFHEKFGVDVKIAWAPDSFGHAAGLPEIYAACGFKYFVFTRTASGIPNLRTPVFSWIGPGGSRVVTLFDKINKCYASCSRSDTKSRLDNTLTHANEMYMENIAVFMGLGNHGGGASQKIIDDIFRWRDAHPEVRVIFSTFTRFFKACEAENMNYPEFQGELNFCLRGCSSSGAILKGKFRQCEALVKRAELVTTAINHYLSRPATDLTSEWKGVLFNTFHDILPGTSIARANEEQIEWMDQVIHNARTKEFEAINSLARNMNIPVRNDGNDMPNGVPWVVFNPLPYVYSGPIELESCMDYRPSIEFENRDDEMLVELTDEAGNVLPAQKIAYEHNAIKPWPWRRRVVTHTEIPAGGWRVFTMTHVRKVSGVEFSVPHVSCGDNFIANEFFKVEAIRNATSLKISRNGQSVLSCNGLQFAVYEDLYGSWGAMDENPEGYLCTKRLQTWHISESKILEKGPEMASMFVVFSGEKSQIRINIKLYRLMDYIEFDAMIIWQDRESRLRMVMDHQPEVTYAVPGGKITRMELGDVPGGRWVQLGDFGIASDSFCGYINLDNEFCVNMIRGCRCASDEPATDVYYQEHPLADYGKHKVKFCITGEKMPVADMAQKLEMPLCQIMTDSHFGELPSKNSLYRIDPPVATILDKEHIQLQTDSSILIEGIMPDGSFIKKELSPWVIIHSNIS